MTTRLTNPITTPELTRLAEKAEAHAFGVFPGRNDDGLRFANGVDRVLTVAKPEGATVRLNGSTVLVVTDTKTIMITRGGMVVLNHDSRKVTMESFVADASDLCSSIAEAVSCVHTEIICGMFPNPYINR